jgi:hypothetical protein
MKQTKLWCRFVPQIGIEQIKGKKGFYFYLYPFVNLVQRNFPEGYHMFTIQGTFLKAFVNYKYITIN